MKDLKWLLDRKQIIWIYKNAGIYNVQNQTYGIDVHDSNLNNAFKEVRNQTVLEILRR